MKPTLVVLAAGMGSRYGGLKQMDPMGPSGETVLDYSVFDAIRAGFGKVIFVIREDFKQAFEEQIISKFKSKITVDICCQKLENLPEGLPADFKFPEDRVKPWGTTHAILAAKDSIEGPFAIINADDFYGRDGLQQVADALVNTATLQADKSKEQYTIVAYKLANTLSENGSVNRGICTHNNGILDSVEEYTEISLAADGTCSGNSEKGERNALPLDSLVSMNLWGFPASILPKLETHFRDFLIERGSEMKSECYIPTVIDALIHSQVAECPLVSSESNWFGVTYPDDKEQVVQSILNLVNEGVYPQSLW